tara:strand:- start:5888 stop:13231 length:7344 start_codon:yes stop_codon:yes gene_type:complete
MTINFNVSPYYDDYDTSKDFLRVLFRPGYSVQARELTTLQTILQRQVSRFGNHIFENGSMVIPGSVNVNSEVNFMKLNDLQDGDAVTTYLTQFKDKIITGQTSGAKALVEDTSECSCMVAGDSTIPSLHFTMMDSGTSGTTKKFVAGEEIVATAVDNSTTTNFRLTANQATDIKVTIKSFGDNGNVGTTYTENASTDVLGKSYRVEVREGIYYIDGFFVQNAEIHLYISRFDTTPSNRVGFEVTEDVVTPEEDTTLNDNAQGTNNFAAPGAHRYKISLGLKRLPLTGTDSIKFVELIRVKDGITQQKVERASYAELEKTLARRTFDESGSYETNKFKLSIKEHLDDGSGVGVYQASPGTTSSSYDATATYGDTDKFAVVVDPGKAYVEGFEVEATQTTYYAVDKSRPTTVGGTTSENNSVIREASQPVGTSIGNYFIARNISKAPAVNSFEKVFLFDTSGAAWLSSGVSAYSAPTSALSSYSGLVGTAFIRSFQLHNGSYSSPTFKTSLFNVSMNEGKSFARDVTWIASSSNGAITGTADFYAEVDPSADSDPINLSGSISLPAQSGGTAATMTGVGTLFQNELKVGDAIVHSGQTVGFVTAIASQISATVQRPSNSDNTGLTGVSISLGRAQLKEPQYNSLLYPTGFQFTKSLKGFDSSNATDTLEQTIHTVRRVNTNTTTGSGDFVMTLSNVNETFLSDTELSNYTLIRNDTGAVINISAADITFDDDANRKEVTIAAGTNGTSCTLYTSVLQVNAAATEKTKVRSTSAEVFTGKTNVVKPEIELSYADGIDITSVTMVPGNFTAHSDVTAVDITANYELDSGQRLTHYQKARLRLKSGAPVPTGAIKVTYRYFAYTGSGNFFSVDSYSAIDYADIPSFEYQDESGNTTTIDLHDTVDYRPVISGSNTFSPEIPKIGTDLTTPVAFYVGRWDKVSISSKGTIQIVAGQPAETPQEPEDPKQGLVLATMKIPPYTKKVGDVKVYQRDNRRYTMRDIGALESRIKNLEYYTSLSLLEKDTKSTAIKDAATGLDRFKNGFVVDDFTGHGVGNVKSEDYNVSIDKKNRTLRPAHFTDVLTVIENISNTTQRATRGYTKTGDLITLPYTETSMVSNPNATRALDVNPYKIGAYKVEVNLFPESSIWKDVDRRPDLTVQDDNNSDAIRFLAEQTGVTGTNWNEWADNWTGSSSQAGGAFSSTTRSGQFQTTNTFQSVTTTETGNRTRGGTRTTISTTTNSQNYGDKVVDMSYIPYIKDEVINIDARNSKPNSQYFVFIDGERVDTNYVKPSDIFKVTQVASTTTPILEPEKLSTGLLADDPARAYDGKIVNAFNFGDVIKNATHTAARIDTITHITSADGAPSFNLTVQDATGLNPGHHVFLYNLNATRGTNATNNRDIEQNISSTITTLGSNHSKQLNRKYFKITAVSGTTITLANLDGTNVSAFDSYARTSAYTGTDGGKLQRLTASAIISYAGVKDSATVRDVHVTNVKNGFAVSEQVTGTADIGLGAKNTLTLTSINGSTVSTTAPTMKATGGSIVSDKEGALNAVLYIPAGRYRTGERSIKLSDNISNTDADFDSFGSALFTANGMQLAKERTVVSSRNLSFVEDRLFQSQPIRRSSVSNRLISSNRIRVAGGGGGGGGGSGNGGGQGHDPLAQTFVVQSDGGAFVTSVDLYFKQAGERPIYVEIRTTDNEVPSTKILPFSQVILQPADITTSTNGSVATNFKFKAPIYLQENESYALVCKVDEPGCEAYISELGGTDLLTENIVGIQPLTGSLYLSQNSREFEINPLLDLKFNLNQASFTADTNGVVQLKANPAETKLLNKDPFQFTNGSELVRVHQRNHGFSANDIVMISGVANGLYGANSTTLGASQDLLNGAHTIQTNGLQKDSYVIDLETVDAQNNDILDGTTADFITGRYGGSVVMASRQLTADALYLKTEDLDFDDCKLAYTVNSTSLAGTASGDKPIVPNATYNFENRKVVKSFENQTTVSSTPLIKTPTLTFNATMSTSNKNVSPILDLQKLGGYAISNLVDSSSTAINVPSIDQKKLINTGDIGLALSTSSGTGTVSTTSASPTVTGSGTSFTTQVSVGDTLTTSAGALGRVKTISSNTSITLCANTAQVSTASTFQITSDPVITFKHGAKGVESNIDAIDNLLDNVIAGSQLYLTNIHSELNGAIDVESVSTTADTLPFGGNEELDKVTINKTSNFSFSEANDIKLDVAQNFTEQVAGFTVTAATSSINVTASGSVDGKLVAGDILVVEDADGPGSLATVGGVQVFNKTILGTVASVNGTNIALAANATTALTAKNIVIRKDISASTWNFSTMEEFVSDTAPVGATNLANYITRTLELANPADALNITFDAYIPKSTDIDVYYKAFSGDTNPDTLNWIDSGFNVASKDSGENFRERNIIVNDIPDFTKVVVKIVMKSTDTTYVPKVQAFRLIAHS